MFLEALGGLVIGGMGSLGPTGGCLDVIGCQHRWTVDLFWVAGVN